MNVEFSHKILSHDLGGLSMGLLFRVGHEVKTLAEVDVSPVVIG